MLESSNRGAHADSTQLLQLAAPLMGIAAAGMFPADWSADIAIATALVCLYCAIELGSRSASVRILRLLRRVIIITGHLVYVAVLCFAWLAMDRVAGPQAGLLVLIFLMLMLSFAAWLACSLLRAAYSVVMCWVVFVSMVAILSGLRLMAPGPTW